MFERIIPFGRKRNEIVKINKDKFKYHLLEFLEIPNKPKNINSLEISLYGKEKGYEINMQSTNLDLENNFDDYIEQLEKLPLDREVLEARYGTIVDREWKNLQEVQTYKTKIFDTSEEKNVEEANLKKANEKFEEVVNFIQNGNYIVHLWPQRVLTLEEIKE